MDKIKITINDKDYNLLVAKTEEEKELGLMNVESMDDDEGMIFVYDEIQPEIAFWMKDTDIALDIIFVNEDDEVISVKKGEPLSEEFLIEYNVFYVIELNQNSGIKKGDIIEFEDEDLPKNKMLILNSDGSIQFTLKGQERIFSRKSSKVIIRKAKRAFKSKSDSDYKSLGRYIFKEMSAQDEREPEYVDAPDNKKTPA